MTKSLSRTCIWLLLVLPPLLVGANRPIFWALNGLLAAFALTVFAWREYQAPLISRDRLFWAAAALLGLGAVWMALQSVSFTPQSWHHPLWQLLPEASSTISLAPAAGWAALGWWMTLAIFFPAMRAGAESPAFARAGLTPLGDPVVMLVQDLFTRQPFRDLVRRLALHSRPLQNLGCWRLISK